MIAARNNLILIVFFFTLIFLIAIAVDASPFLRGPADSVIESRWPYYFVNTFSKLWIFAPIYMGFLLIIRRVDTLKNIKTSREWLILICLVLLVFAFQLALVYFSRFGITVLFRRLVDPGINGYFTESLNIDNLSSFLSNFPAMVNSRTLSQHASGHTPGAVLLTKGLVDLISLVPTNYISFLNNFQVGWAKDLWNSLTLHQKFAGITIPFLLHLLSSVVIIPFYFIAKSIFGDVRSSFRTTILYSVIPSLSFFALVMDPLYALFPLIATLLILAGVRRKQSNYFFLAGITCGIGLFFTAAILTYLAGLFVFVVISNKTVLVKSVIKFLTGIVYVVLIFYLIRFDLIASLQAVIHNQASREYLHWVAYNPYDFFVFMGLPLSIIFIYQTYLIIRKKIVLNSILKNVFLAFWITFLTLIISGASRGEVGRIWLLFMFIPVIFAGNFINQTVKFSNKQFLILFTLLFIQTIILEEFWVPIW